MSKDLQTKKDDYDHSAIPNYLAPHLIPKVQSTIQPKVYSKIPVRLIPSIGKTKSYPENRISEKLPEEVQTKMENSFSQDFSNVNIHKDSSSAQDIHAKAYAQGNDIHFAPGEYDPSSKAGHELIGHELTHVVQQKQGKVNSSTINRKSLAITQETEFEKEADEAGKLASEGKNVEISLQAPVSTQMKDDKDEKPLWKEVDDPVNYLISSKDAFIREIKDNDFISTENKILKWTEVKIIKESHDGKYVFVKQTKDSPLKKKVNETQNTTEASISDTTRVAADPSLEDNTSEKQTEWWTSKSNLYSTNWDPKDNEAAYKKISTKYADQMLQNDPKETIKDSTLSGSSTKSIVDKYFKNSTDPADLDPGFKTKFDKLKKCFNDNGITFSVSAMLRHPLRSAIFNYTIAVRDASSIDIICEANAVCKKYGIPINWAHLDKDGNIDLEESKAKAKIVSNAFALGKNAARSIPDFGGAGISNHNHGKAIDLSVSFSFTEKKMITFEGTDYEIDPVTELEGQTSKNFKDVSNSPLTLLGKSASGLSRSIDTDPIHWSESGN